MKKVIFRHQFQALSTLITAVLLLTFCWPEALAENEARSGPKILVVVAHPDDEVAMAATIYRITHDLKGTVDQCVITNGEGGYKYATQAEPIYGLRLTDESVGRANLPRIRKQEMINAGKIIGTNQYFFLDEKDAKFGLDEHEPLDTTWNIARISDKLRELMTKTHYDFVFCLLPTPETHAHHKAATLLALRAVQSLPLPVRPVILACPELTQQQSPEKFSQLNSYAETKVVGSEPTFVFDRKTSFGYNNKLNYKIVVNWVIAEHKSQGANQLLMNVGDSENYWLFAINRPEDRAKCEKLFDSLKEAPAAR